MMTSAGRVFAQAPALGAAADYGLLSGASLQSATALPLTGKAGSTGTVAATITASNGTFASGSGTVAAALAAAQAARNWCATRPGQIALPALNGQVLPAGVYSLNGDAALEVNQRLTLSGDTGSVYIFNIGGSLSVASLAHLILGEVRPGHVFWHVAGNVTAPGYSTWQGIVLAGGKVCLPRATGTLAVLAADSVRFGPRDPDEDRLTVASPSVLRIGVPGDPGPVVMPPRPTKPPCGEVACSNLVGNGSFEEGQCVVPTFDADFSYYQTRAPATTPAPFWARVGCWMGYSSPDWFTSTPRFAQQPNCLRPNSGNPLNRLNSTGPGTTPSTRLARTGTSYAGIYSLDQLDSGLYDAANNRVDGREYIIQTLNQPLTPGRPCYAEYYASLAPASMYTLKKLQIGFTATPPNSEGYDAAAILPAGSVAVVASNTALARGLGQPWDHVQGWFTPPAGSTYSTMVLGNFTPGDVDRSPAAGGPAYAAPTAGGYNTGNRKPGAYYYIDDVVLAPFTTAGPAVVAIDCEARVLLGGCALPAAAGANYSWSPTSYLDNPYSANPTASLPAALPGGATSITYTLTVVAGGQAPYSTSTTLVINNGVPCDSCKHPYAQNGGATYTITSQIPNAPKDYILGIPNTIFRAPGTQPPVIDAGGGTVVFDGIYHVVSPIELRNGTFKVLPGTVFYVDGGRHNAGVLSACYGTQVLDDFFIIRVGPNAKVYAEGATFTSNCKEQWGGIVMVDNGLLDTRADQLGRHCEISQARVGVLVGTPCSSKDANCLLTETDFVNDTYGVVSLGFPSQRAPNLNGITGCTFSSDLTQILPPWLVGPGSATPYGPTYTSAGLVLHGKWHDDIEYSKNHFTSVYVGAEVAGGTGQMRLHDNEFEDNFGAGIQVAEFGFNSGVGPINRPGVMQLDQNYFTLPDNPSPGGQVDPANPVLGIEVLPLSLGGKALEIENNSFYGLYGPGAPRYQIGINAMLSFDLHHIQRQNHFTYLDEGVHLMDASGATTREEYVTDNFFGKCDRGVVLDGQTYAPYAPAVSCNTFDSCSQGIAVDGASTVGYLAGPFGGPAGIEPSANAYPSTGDDVWNDGLYSIDYYRLDVPFESVSTGGGSTVLPITIPGTPCDTRPTYGPGVYGLYRPAAAAGTAPQQVQDWEDALEQAAAPAAALHKQTLQLIDYRERNGQPWPVGKLCQHATHGERRGF